MIRIGDEYTRFGIRDTRPRNDVEATMCQVYDLYPAAKISRDIGDHPDRRIHKPN